MASDTQPPTYILVLSCPDQIGVVADVANFLVQHQCNITESGQFSDPDNGLFFLRNAFRPMSGVDLQTLRRNFEVVAARHAIKAQFFDAAVKVKSLVLVSKLGHCLNDLIFRNATGALPIEIVGVISNHPDFEQLTRSAGLAFDYLPVTAETKAKQEAQIQKIAEARGAELIVLARYMQVLSGDFCGKWSGRIINIHHSFLPSFKGAQPYQRAHARGVKLVGATAHYVTDDLDEGPIIEQGVHRVQHSMTAADFVAGGRDVEAVVLARAVKWHAERRILLSGLRTVVFP
ncbi:MAG: formyltetrahydrofolate deformylase [Caulobacteraceae bacterium]|nr:formyltetrahydrofolate deformylase [Caulobacteraceae bacterium]